MGKKEAFMVQKLFKSGAFAKLCNTTKDTLFHYDDIGILKPAQVSSNGLFLKSDVHV